MRVRLFVFFVFLLHPLSAVHFHATQGMDRCSHSVGADCAWASSEVRTVASGSQTQCPSIRGSATRSRTSFATRESTSHQSSKFGSRVGGEDGDSSSFAESQGSHNTSTPSSVDSGCSEGGSEDENRPSRESIGSLAGLFWTRDRRVEECVEESQRSRAGTTSREADCGVQRVHRAQTVLLEDARQRLARLEQRVAAVPTVPEAAVGVANVDLLRAKLAEAERDELRGRKRRATPVHPLSDPVGPECPDSSNARRRAGVVRLVARQTHRSQDVLEFGTRNEILQMTSTVADGAAKLAEFTTMATT